MPSATEVESRLIIAGDELEIMIVDNGKGFNKASLRRGQGLKNLPLRLSQIGGRYDAESTPGKGTLVTIALKFDGQTRTRAQRAPRRPFDLWISGRRRGKLFSIDWCQMTRKQMTAYQRVVRDDQSGCCGRQFNVAAIPGQVGFQCGLLLCLHLRFRGRRR